MADLTNYKVYKNTDFEVLTDEGFKKFNGIIVGTNKCKIKINFSNGKELICTPKHKIIVDTEFNFLYAKDLTVGKKIYNNIVVENITSYEDEVPVYELLEVEKNHRYFANGILSKQCLILDELAFIDNHLVEDFWNSVYPIISSSKKSKIFVASTPKGTGNLFHKLYSEATEGKNDWHAERVDWWEVPGRDETWKEKTIRSLGNREAFDQEFGNVFVETGESAVDEKLFDELRANCSEPSLIYDDGKYLLWETPEQDKLYVAGVDVSEGVGEAASVIQILDITDLQEIKQVATYHDKTISPFNFTTKLNEILRHWGSPPALIERNNCGAQVVDQLKYTYNYENIVSYGVKAGNLSFNKVGVVAHTNTKYKGVTNMRYFVNELRCVRIRDIRTLNELKSFVRYPNGTWAAKPGSDSHDDRVMSLIWALIILENELAEKYYEIEEYDDNRRPLKMRTLDYGIKYFVNPTSMYNTQQNSEETPPLPLLFNENFNESDELITLQGEGWKPLY